MSDLLAIGTSALLNYQRALSTTSHNIANINTAGYSRQNVEFGTNNPKFEGGTWYGTGAHVVSVNRAYNGLLTEQVRIHTTLAERADAYYGYAKQVDDILSDSKAGLGAAVNSFFTAVQGVANDPSSTPARQVMITSGQSLVDRFHYVDNRLDEIEQQVSRDVETTVAEINELGTAIAQLNSDISFAYGATGHAPNDLLDQRDALLEELSGKVQVQVVVNDSLMANVFMGTGQPLVLDASSGSLSVEPNIYVPTVRDIQLNLAGQGGTTVTTQMTGGALGGAMDFMNDILLPARRDLGQIAAAVSVSFNDQHRLGIDLQNQLGGDFFTEPVPRVFANANNTTQNVPALVDFDVDGIANLTTNDYYLKYDGVDWSLTNAQTGVVTPLSYGTGGGVAPDGTDATPWKVDGLSISVEDIVGTVGAGDSFLIQPTANAAEEIAQRIEEPSQVAAASAVAVQQTTDAQGRPVNTGTGLVDQVRLSRSSGIDPQFTLLPMGDDITLTYDGTNYNLSSTLGFNITPPTIAYAAGTNNGMSATVTIDDGAPLPLTRSVDITFRLSGSPAAGDSFILYDNDNGASSDNTNALQLAALESRKLMNGGTASYNDANGEMLADASTKTHRAEITADAETVLQDQAKELRDNVSAVNLDQEAASLLDFQQAYQASSRVISTANTLFDTLLKVVG